MKTLLKTIALAALAALPLTTMTAEPEKPAADKMHKIVFEVSIDGAEKWQGALRNVENVHKSLGVRTTKMEVVAHGKAADWAPYIEVDGQLVTGQNPASSGPAAKELLKLQRSL